MWSAIGHGETADSRPGRVGLRISILTPTSLARYTIEGFQRTFSLAGRGVSYGYDNDCRLTSEAITSDPAGNNGALGYTYGDGVGNRTQMTSTVSVLGPGSSFSYDPNEAVTRSPLTVLKVGLTKL